MLDCIPVKLEQYDVWLVKQLKKTHFVVLFEFLTPKSKRATKKTHCTEHEFFH